MILSRDNDNNNKIDVEDNNDIINDNPSGLDENITNSRIGDYPVNNRATNNAHDSSELKGIRTFSELSPATSDLQSSSPIPRTHIHNQEEEVEQLGIFSTRQTLSFLSNLIVKSFVNGLIFLQPPTKLRKNVLFKIHKIGLYFIKLNKSLFCFV